MSELQINKSNYVDCRVIDVDLTSKALADNEVLVKIDKFALSANNITYAVVGEQIGYWQFFPPHASANNAAENLAAWGILPVWGYANVVKSNNAEVPVGERLFGYFPPASHLIMKPTKVRSTAWVDGSSHRAALPVSYNLYTKVESEKAYKKEFEDDRMLLYPLHITAFALYDYFKSNDWFGASQVIILSASSKTSIGLAYGIENDRSAPKQIGLTSSANHQMVKRLGIYDRTLSYDQISEIDASKPSLIVDMSGNGKVLNDLHSYLGENMRFCSNVGVTHWKQTSNGPDFIKERSEFFFAPSQLQKRIKEWGMQGFEEKSAAYLRYSFEQSREWLEMIEIDGLKGMSNIFADLCDGKIAPTVGLIIRMPS